MSKAGAAMGLDTAYQLAVQTKQLANYRYSSHSSLYQPFAGQCSVLLGFTSSSALVIIALENCDSNQRRSLQPSDRREYLNESGASA